MCVIAEVSDAAGAEAYHSLQARQQALQRSSAEQLVQSTACQHSLEQQVQSLQSELTAAQRERDAAMAGMKALQTCDETKKCNLHIGLSQVSLSDIRSVLADAVYCACAIRCIRHHDKVLRLTTLLYNNTTVSFSCYSLSPQCHKTWMLAHLSSIAAGQIGWIKDY